MKRRGKLRDLRAETGLLFSTTAMAEVHKFESSHLLR
jgi:hypothetical protein